MLSGGARMSAMAAVAHGAGLLGGERLGHCLTPARNSLSPAGLDPEGHQPVAISAHRAASAVTTAEAPLTMFGSAISDLGDRFAAADPIDS